MSAAKLKNMIIKTFQTDREILRWLADTSNLEKLKEDYPPDEYTASINVNRKQIEIYKKDNKED